MAKTRALTWKALTKLSLLREKKTLKRGFNIEGVKMGVRGPKYQRRRPGALT